MNKQSQIQSFVPLEPAAIQLGLPQTFLRELADKRIVPCLRVGRRRLFNVEDVAEALRRDYAQHALAKGGGQ